MFTLLPSSENSWNGERDLPPPTLRGLGVGGAVREGRPLHPALPGAGSPPLPPRRGRPAAEPCAGMGTNSQVSEGRVETILVSSPSLTPLLPGAHVPGSGRRVFPEARTTLPSKPGEADPRHEVCIKMGRCVQGWERMTRWERGK